MQRKWYLVDAEGKTIALRRKSPPCEGKISRRLPHVDTGDHVVIVNAEKVILTGNKMENKTYSTHSGFPGGLKTLTAEHVHRKTLQAVDESHRGHVAEKSTW